MISTKILNEIKREIKGLRDFGYSEGKIRSMILNRCYIKNIMDEVRGYCSIYEENETISSLFQPINEEINKLFYTKYNTNKFSKPTIKKIVAESPYTLKEFGNVVVPEFRDPEKVELTEIEVEGACRLDDIFTAVSTESGELGFVCKPRKKTDREF